MKTNISVYKPYLKTIRRQEAETMNLTISPVIQIRIATAAKL
jgi:hypothetical protein